MRLAILDLGTNTFNLLVAEVNDKEYRILYNGRLAVKLGRGGIQNNRILPEAIQRGMEALTKHHQTYTAFGDIKVLAFATSVFRSTINGKEFVSKIKHRFGIDVQIIDGNREADLIYYGVRRSVDLSEKYLILDIGGGSNEFIIADNNQVFWKQSFPLGMARLLEKFNLSDPIRENEIIALENYFEEELKPLFTAFNKYHPSLLVGDEGSFETLYAMIHQLDYHTFPRINMASENLSLEKLEHLHLLLLKSNTEQRSLLQGLDPIRIEMIVPASIFIRFIIRRLNISQLKVSFYSLKEGALFEWIDEQKI